MHVPLHLGKQRIVFDAVLATALLPALTLAAEVGGRDYMFPLDTVGAVRLLAHLITATGQIRHHLLALITDIAAAVEGGLFGVLGIELAQRLLASTKVRAWAGWARASSKER